MNKIEDIISAIEYLNNGEYLTSDGQNLFYLKDNKIKIKDKNANYSLNIEDFMKLYKNDIEIDDSKDEAYYRFYKK